MVKTPHARHSKSRREPLTIDLDAENVSRVESEEGQPVTEPLEGRDASGEAEASVPPADEVETTTANEAVGIEATAGEAETASTAEQADLTAMKAEPSDERETTAPPPQPEPSRQSAFVLVAAGIVGGVVTLAGAGALQWAGVLPVAGTDANASASEIQALQQDLAQLKAARSENSPADLAGMTASIEDARTEVARLQSEIEELRSAAPAAGSDTSERLDAVEAKLASLGVATDSAGLDAVQQKLTGLEQAVSGANAAAAKAGETAAAANAAAKANADRLAALEKTVAGLSGKLEATAEEPNVAAAIAASALKSAIERGEPFSSELDTYAAVVPSAEAVAPLRDLAAKGVPTHADLVAGVDEAADAMIAAAKPVDRNAGIFDRLLASAESLVKVRPVGAIKGDSVEATVARMEVAVRDGELPKAVSEYESLPEAVQQAGAGFIGKVKVRIEADRLAGELLASTLKSPADAKETTE